jgi:putative endonuclease
MMYFVYILIAMNPSGRSITYVGWTVDLERRLAEHNDGPRGAKSTRGRTWSLAYAERHISKRAAMAREAALKRDRALRGALRAAWR